MVTFSIEVDGIIENISVSEDFKPIYGCAEVCPIETNEKKHGGEICCMNSRKCCFFCDEELYPIVEKYSEIIQYFSPIGCGVLKENEDS